MEVILKKDVETVGKRGEVIQVKGGYARNFLIPNGLAVPASKLAKEEIERQREREQKREEKERQEFQELAARLEKSSCTIAAQANEEGHLFGSVTEADIVAAFREEGLTLQAEQVVLEAPIKEIGVYGFRIRLRPDMEVTSKVWVVKE
ncbi:MAG: 50S ribosomal protein L9 [Planctomycetes bacterium]|nr:50S ribosomal protein L9 [Planctomycetota bacterium]